MGIPMVDWQRNKRFLIDGSDAAVRAFIAQHAGDELRAIGYVFELGNAWPSFYLCANTRPYFEESIARYRDQWPHIPEDEIRWNSGDYEFPAGLVNPDDELGGEWNAEYAKLHELVDRAHEDDQIRSVYIGLIKIGSEAMADLAKRGLFGDWSRVDFNVSCVDDRFEVVKKRDQHIRNLICGCG